MSAPFVGRQRERSEISALVRRSSLDRAPVAALVTGEPGSGKTRLLTEILAAPRTAGLVRVVGFEPNQAVPLAAVGEVIRLLSTVPVHGPEPRTTGVRWPRSHGSRTPPDLRGGASGTLLLRTTRDRHRRPPVGRRSITWADPLPPTGGGPGAPAPGRARRQSPVTRGDGFPRHARGRPPDGAADVRGPWSAAPRGRPFAGPRHRRHLE